MKKTKNTIQLEITFIDTKKVSKMEYFFFNLIYIKKIGKNMSNTVIYVVYQTKLKIEKIGFVISTSVKLKNI